MFEHVSASGTVLFDLRMGRAYQADGGERRTTKMRADAPDLLDMFEAAAEAWMHVRVADLTRNEGMSRSDAMVLASTSAPPWIRGFLNREYHAEFDPPDQREVA